MTKEVYQAVPTKDVEKGDVAMATPVVVVQQDARRSRWVAIPVVMACALLLMGFASCDHKHQHLHYHHNEAHDRKHHRGDMPPPPVGPDGRPLPPLPPPVGPDGRPLPPPHHGHHGSHSGSSHHGGHHHPHHGGSSSSSSKSSSSKSSSSKSHKGFLGWFKSSSSSSSSSDDSPDDSEDTPMIIEDEDMLPPPGSPDIAYSVKARPALEQPDLYGLDEDVVSISEDKIIIDSARPEESASVSTSASYDGGVQMMVDPPMEAEDNIEVEEIVEEEGEFIEEDVDTAVERLDEEP